MELVTLSSFCNRYIKILATVVLNPSYSLAAFFSTLTFAAPGILTINCKLKTKLKQYEVGPSCIQGQTIVKKDKTASTVPTTVF